MNAITMLKHDHRTVRGLFRKFEQAGERAVIHKQRISDQLFHELEVHTTVEQEIFYPAVRDAGDDKGRALVVEAFAEHDVVTNLISDLKALAPGTDAYGAEFMVLIENVKHHMDEEESQLFPYSEKTLDEIKLRDLGRQMADRKQALIAPTLISESLRRAKSFVSEAVAAVTGARHEAHRRRRTTSHKRTTPASVREHKGGQAGHGRSIATRKSDTHARAT